MLCKCWEEHIFAHVEVEEEAEKEVVAEDVVMHLRMQSNKILVTLSAMR